jgi:hypothetical protein
MKQEAHALTVSLTLLLSCLAMRGFASPAWLWARTGGGATATDNCRGAACDASGVTYITGDFTGPDCLIGGALYSSASAAADAYVIRYLADGSRAWVRVLGRADGKLSRGLVTIVPERFGTLDCGRLTVALPAGAAEKNWSARTVSYSLERPPQISAIALTRGGDSLTVPVNQIVSGAWLLMFADEPETLPKP